MQNDDSLSKTEAAYRVLRRDILATRLMPGAPLKLQALRNAYGIGWTPLREALSRLEAERLVTAISNRGFAVAPVSREELEDLERARMVLELPLFLESIEKGGNDWESAVLTAHFRLSRCKTAAEDSSEEAIDAWYDKHEAFHGGLLSATTSNWLLRFRLTISDQMRRHHRFLGLAPAVRVAAGRKKGCQEAFAALNEVQSIEAHTSLMEAALDRDLESARALMINHIGYTLRVFAAIEDSDTQAQAGRVGDGTTRSAAE